MGVVVSAQLAGYLTAAVLGLAAGAVRVPGVSEWAMGVCLDGTTLYVVAGDRAQAGLRQLGGLPTGTEHCGTAERRLD